MTPASDFTTAKDLRNAIPARGELLTAFAQSVLTVVAHPERGQSCIREFENFAYGYISKTYPNLRQDVCDTVHALRRIRKEMSGSSRAIRAMQETKRPCGEIIEC
ncbi:MAG: hypothetical protein MJ014_00015 [Methanocorpusculum sp.]|nr:hypothetical protein [Methanocorpusculum sp.]